MSYAELIELALKGRSVNKAAKEMGINQPTLDRLAKGKHVPSYQTAKKLAEEAGISYEEAFLACAELEAQRTKAEKTSANFDWVWQLLSPRGDLIPAY